MTASAREHVLTLDCGERPGIVSAVSGFLAERDFDILDIVQFGDRRGSSRNYAARRAIFRSICSIRRHGCATPAQPKKSR